MHIQVCVICKVKRPPLFSLRLEYREILEAIISSDVDITLLRGCRLVACLDCHRLIETVVVFRRTALAGVRNLLSLLPVVEPTPSEPDRLDVPIKNEPEEELTETIPSFVLDEPESEPDPLDAPIKNEPEELTETCKPWCIIGEPESLKTFPEVKTEDHDSSATESCESDPEEHIAVHSVKKEDVPVGRKAEATQVAVDKPRQLVTVVHRNENMAVPFMDQRLVPMSSQGRGATLVGRAPVTPEREIVTVGRGAVTVERGAFAVRMGTVTAKRATVTVERGTVTVQRGAFAVRRGTVTVGRGAETVARGRVTAGRATVFTVGRGTVPVATGEDGEVTLGRGVAAVVGKVTSSVGRETDTLREGAVTAGRGRVTVGRGAATVGRGAATVRKGTTTVQRGAATVARGNTAKRPSLQPTPSGSKRAETIQKPPDTQATKPKYNPNNPYSPWYIYVLQDHEVTAEHEAIRNSKQYTEAEFRCEPCLRTFASAAEVETHAKLHLKSAGQFECLVCTQRMSTEDELSLHQPQHSFRYNCCNCSYTTPDKGKITKHTCDPEELERIALTNRPERKRYHYPVTCMECNSRFPDEYALAGHTKRRHSEPDEPTNCKECGKTFKNKFFMKKHAYTHSRVQKGLENLCPELFCAECKIPFGTHSAYRQHRQSLRHSDKDHWRFECDYCGRKCRSKYSVNLHIKLMHTQDREFKCSKCPKGYVSRVRLQKHEQTHLPDTRPRPHICERCGKAFLHKSSLEQHMNIHNGLRPYKCKFCPATFSFAAAALTHTKLKHLKIKRVWKKKPSKKKLKTKEERLDSEKS